jgi:hypothetical protein
MNQLSPKQVLERHRKRLMKLTGVVGVGFGLSPTNPGKRCLLVYVSVADRPPGIPAQLDGYDVEVVRAPGGFRPL